MGGDFPLCSVNEAAEELGRIEKLGIKEYKEDAIFYNSAINTALSVLGEISNGEAQGGGGELEKKIRNEIAQHINDRIANAIMANTADMSLSVSAPYAIGGSDIIACLQKLIRK
ncbi:MAG: transposase [Candidatus Marsarchaeota archaeon]|nr:transposase [Candidatus Marsarchaeota archaeon]MCL5106161.1 transposase [Candidatus Marsarchaeota archaeon]